MHIDCQFHLSRPSAVYYTGEQIFGTLTLSVAKKPLQLESISITLLGRSTTSWTESTKCSLQIEHNDSSAYTEPHQISYEAKKTHMEQTQELAQSTLLQPGGSWLSEFEFALPHGMPSTCSLVHGSTNYILQATLERRSKHTKRFQLRLILRNRIELLDLLPATCASSTLSLSLPRSNFVPGQSVAYQLHSTVPHAHCQSVTRLYQCINYVSQAPVAKTKTVVTLLDESCDSQNALHLPLRAHIMTQLPDELIEISYFVETQSEGGNKALRLPIFVGTIAPPVDDTANTADSPSLGFINLALSENELLLTTINQLLPHSCFRELNVLHTTKYTENHKLLRRQKKPSYVRLALRYFSKSLLPS